MRRGIICSRKKFSVHVVTTEKTFVMRTEIRVLLVNHIARDWMTKTRY